MNKKSTIGWLTGIVVITLVVGASWYSLTHAKSQSKPIEVGWIGPLTGPDATFGQEEKNVISMALEDINSHGGIKGRPIQMIYEDGQCSGQAAANAAQKLVSVDQVKIILGGACSGETLAAEPITNPAHVILFSSFSSNAAVTEAGDHYVFRNTPPDTTMADGEVEVAVKDGFTKLALLTETTDYAQGMRTEILQKIQELGATVVADESYDSSATDFRTELTKIKAANPDALLVVAQSGVSAGLIVKQANQLALGAKIYGDNAFSSGDIFHVAGSALNGIKFIDEPGLNGGNSQAEGLLTRYEARYGTPASEWGIGTRYDSVYILANALRACDVDTDCIQHYLHTMPNYNGVAGTYHFDQKGDPVGMKTYTVKIVTEGATGKIEDL